MCIVIQTWEERGRIYESREWIYTENIIYIKLKGEIIMQNIEVMTDSQKLDYIVNEM